MAKSLPVSSDSVDEINRELYVRNAELAVRNKTLSLLRSIDDVTMTSLGTDDMTREIASILTRAFDYPFVAIAVHEPKRRALVWKAFSCLDSKQPLCVSVDTAKSIPLSRKDHVCARALSKGKGMVISRLDHVLDGSVSPEVVKMFRVNAHLKQTLVFPMSAQTGLLVIGLNRAASDLTSYEKDTFASLMNLVTIAIQKAQTYSSLVDTTTKLRSANKKLKELDSLKTEFLSIASHQLRTPLAVVKGYAAMLKDGMLGTLNEKQTGAVATVQTAIEQLILLVNHLLDLTRIESGRLQVKPEVVDLNATLTWLVGFMQPKVVEKGLKLTLASPNDIRVTADLEKLKEVLMNLVDNAVKYTEQGSVTVTVRAEKNLAVVEVKDTGYGLTPEDKARLFEKFATGSASKFVKTTSGLGLYVVRKLMTAMGGTVEAESKGKGKGSTFIVTIPLAKDKGV